MEFDPKVGFYKWFFVSLLGIGVLYTGRAGAVIPGAPSLPSRASTTTSSQGKRALSSKGTSSSLPPAANTKPDAGSEPLPLSISPKYPPPKPSMLFLAGPGGGKLEAELRAGDQAVAKAMWKEALQHYENARAFGPKRAAPLVGIARVRIANVGLPIAYASAKGNADVKAAADLLRQAIEFEPSCGAAQFELGRTFLLLGDAQEAVECLRKAVKYLPDEAEAPSALGIALLATGHADESLLSLKRAVELDPGSAPRHSNLGTVFLMGGFVKEAIQEYEASLLIDPSSAQVHSDLGTALLGTPHIERALQELQKAIELAPKRATFHSNLGYALQVQGRLQEAIAEYREALKLDSNLASAWINLGVALARDPKTHREAREALKHAQALDSTDPRVQANLEELDALEKKKGKP